MGEREEEKNCTLWKFICLFTDTSLLIRRHAPPSLIFLVSFFLFFLFYRRRRYFSIVIIVIVRSLLLCTLFFLFEILSFSTSVISNISHFSFFVLLSVSTLRFVPSFSDMILNSVRPALDSRELLCGEIVMRFLSAGRLFFYLFSRVANSFWLELKGCAGRPIISRALIFA